MDYFERCIDKVEVSRSEINMTVQCTYLSVVC